MSIEKVREILLLCTVINYGLLIWWWLLFMYAHDWMNRLSRRWFLLSNEQSDSLQFGGIILYKLIIIVFNLVPCIALYIVH